MRNPARDAATGARRTAGRRERSGDKGRHGAGVTWTGWAARAATHPVAPLADGRAWFCTPRRGGDLQVRG
jgi:hypothetical protein